jgi:sporulation protein YlmC with PRC-barrel domain
MSEATEYVIGTEVVCSDGACGELRRVVIDPVARAITHLVVEPKHRKGCGHLVPIGLVTAADETEIRLQSDLHEFHLLEDAEESEYISGASGEWNYEQNEMLSLPYAAGLGAAGIGSMGTGLGKTGSGPHAFIEDKVPVGEVDIRRGDSVHATDGEIGHVAGLVIDPADHHVTHVLLDEGHLWGAKRVAIPIGAVTKVDFGVRVTLSKDEVKDLPPVELAQLD